MTSEANIDPVLAGAPHRISKVALVVRDLDRLAGFYRDILGLRVLSQDREGALLGTNRAALLELRHDPAASPRSPRDAGLFHTAFLLPGRSDLGAWLAFAKARGIALQGAADHTVSEAVYLSDPEGNGIEIYVDRPSSLWPNDNGTIQMANDRLDLPGLAAEAEGRDWSGFPEAGIVGHVHLQVGEIAAAEAFYGGVLGFDVTCRYSGASFFGSGGYHHQLAGNVWNSRGAGPRPRGAAGLAEVEIATEEGTLRATAERAGHSLADRNALTLSDPWGTAISLRVD